MSGKAKHLGQGMGDDPLDGLAFNNLANSAYIAQSFQFLEKRATEIVATPDSEIKYDRDPATLS